MIFPPCYRNGREVTTTVMLPTQESVFVNAITYLIIATCSIKKNEAGRREVCT